MSIVDALPALGDQAFWTLYDEFCQQENLQYLIETGTALHLAKIKTLMDAGHRSKELFTLGRSERGWKMIKAWLVIEKRDVLHEGGYPWLSLRVGDVIGIQPSWDRVGILTHVPINNNLPRGRLHHTQEGETIGCFMPLYERNTIMTCIQARLTMNARMALMETMVEANEWKWY